MAVGGGDGRARWWCPVDDLGEPMSGVQVFSLTVIIAVGFVFGLWAMYTDRRDRYEVESHVELLRELSRHEHPSMFEDDDWTPPHGIGRP